MLSAGYSLSTPRFLLDTYPGAAAAYSLRKLRSGYSGPCVRVRRSSDNAEKDIGFSGETLDETALLNFVGNNDGFVVTWYGQSSNARDISENTQARQPQIVSSGSILTSNSLPTLDFEGSVLHKNGFTISQPFTSFAVTEYTSTDTEFVHDGWNLDGSKPDNSHRVILRELNGNNHIFAGSNMAGSVKKQVLHAQSAHYEGASSNIFINGSSDATGDAGTNDLTDGFVVGSDHKASLPGNDHDGNISELVIFGVSQKSNQSAIQQNQIDYYNL
ncbi:hypothetical protein GGP77_001638 [Salinibacter ruber]|uniref:arabinofuranosidase catalytic domain-containing protein n=1 Tax=Salinibacter ruber TaxID=146919 RepID=UPI0021691978|nr:arabinofuranosidase catalytic domain-containing protein [Salinibacter ruber]MCS3667409.1 hypothetical protein [Salinibacter ruber]